MMEVTMLMQPTGDGGVCDTINVTNFVIWHDILLNMD
jgi:hypothetical protein